MNIRNIFRFSFDNMSKNVKKVLIIVLLQVIIFVMIGQVLVEYNKQKYVLDKCESILSSPVEKCEAIDFESADLSDEKITEFVKEIYEMEGLLAVGDKCSGRIGVVNTIFDGRLKEIQSSNPDKSYIETEDSLKCRMIQASLLPYYDFDYAEKPDISKNQPMDTAYMVLGNAYKDIPVGSEYVHVSESGLELHFVVAGILEKGEEFVETSIVEPQIIEILNCDYEIFIMYPMSDSGYLIPYVSYAIDENYTVEEIHNEIIRIAEKHGIARADISFLNAEKSLEISNEPMNYVVGMILDIAVIIIVATILVSICIQTVNIIDSTNMYGIMYANGATRKDVAIMIVLENLVKTILAIITAYAFARLYYGMAFDESVTFTTELTVLNGIVIYQVIGIAMLITAISTIVPLIIINRNTPSKLIREIM